MTAKVRLAIRVIQKRIDDGEILDTILLDYPKLVGDELQEVLNNLVLPSAQ